MMINFMTLHSSLAPLIDCLCSSNPCGLTFEGLGVMFATLDFIFWKEKYIKERKQMVQDLIPPAFVYTQMYYVHMWI